MNNNDLMKNIILFYVHVHMYSSKIDQDFKMLGSPRIEQILCCIITAAEAQHYLAFGHNKWLNYAIFVP